MDILGFEQDDNDDVVEVLIACSCGAIATFRRVAVDPAETKGHPCHGSDKWQYRVVHGSPEK